MVLCVIDVMESKYPSIGFPSIFDGLTFRSGMKVGHMNSHSCKPSNLHFTPTPYL